MSELATEQRLEPHDLHRPRIRSARSKNATRGLIAALFGCLFGLIGVFAFSVLFVPLAILCGLVGLLRAGSIAVVGVSMLAWLLAAAGFATSPTLLLMTGAALLIGTVGSPPTAVSNPVNTPGAFASKRTEIQSQVQPSTPKPGPAPRKEAAESTSMRQVAQSGYWAAYAGIGEGGKWTCAMVSGLGDGSSAQFIIEHQSGSPGVMLRAIDPRQPIRQVVKSHLYVSLPMQAARVLDAASSGRETRAQFPITQLSQFLRSIASTEELQIAVEIQASRPWILSTTGQSEVLQQFNGCIQIGGKA